MYDMYLTLDGIKGESTASGHEGWIELTHYGHQMSQPVSQTRSSAGGGTTGKTQHGDIVVTKFLDSSSPKLYAAVSNGTHIAKGQIDFVRAGGSALVFHTIALQQIVISKVAPTSDLENLSTVSAGGSTDTPGGGAASASTMAPNELPGEQLHLNYGIISWTYTQQKRKDGSGGGSVSATVDLTTGKTS
jgi:type VI secretion system secreted protein Hcp